MPTTRPTAGDVYIPFARAPLRAPYGDARLSEEEKRLLDDPGPGIFVDCLHFDGPFFAHLGSISRDPQLLGIAAEQTLGTIALLQDPETGLFAHFWLEKTGRTYGYGWGRGQGWALLGLLHVLEYLPNDHPAWPAIHRALRQLAHGLAATQDPSGHWPAIAPEPETDLETSTALFVTAGFAKAIASGLLDDELREACERAWAAGMSAVDANGLVTGVSTAVWASTALGHYRAVPRGSLVPWGQGPLLLAAKAMLDAAEVPEP